VACAAAKTGRSAHGPETEVKSCLAVQDRRAVLLGPRHTPGGRGEGRGPRRGQAQGEGEGVFACRIRPRAVGDDEWI